MSTTVASPTPARASWASRLRPSRHTLAVLWVYAVCRLVSGTLVALDAPRQVPTGWTGPEVNYLTYLTQWDGQWYKIGALTGYPTTLPIGPNGLVEQNPWAFYPLYPFLSRAVMFVTGMSFEAASSTLSLVLGFGAAVLMAALLRPRIGSWPTLAVILVWASLPPAMVLQASYTESLAMVVLLAYLLAVERRRWGTAAWLAIVVGLTRPIAAPLGVVLLAALLVRWRGREREPVERPERIRMLSAVVGTGIGAGIWPAIAWLVTGQMSAYPETMASWRASHAITPITPWFDTMRYWFGSVMGIVWFVVVLVSIVALMAGPWASRLGVVMRVWVIAYTGYLVAVLDPSTSIFRYLIPMFPIVAVLIGVAGVRRQPVWLTVGRTAVLFVGFVICQWWWIDELWRFVPPSDWPP